MIQKTKFEYSPLGKVFTKGLDESDKKEGLLKGLKNIEGKNKDQLDAIRDEGEKQLNAIEQKKNKIKIIEKDEKIVYLRDGINKLFRTYPESFNQKKKHKSVGSSCNK